MKTVLIMMLVVLSSCTSRISKRKLLIQSTQTVVVCDQAWVDPCGVSAKGCLVLPSGDSKVDMFCHQGVLTAGEND